MFHLEVLLHELVCCKRGGGRCQKKERLHTVCNERAFTARLLNKRSQLIEVVLAFKSTEASGTT